MENQNNQQNIIALLQEQNQTLHKLLELQLRHDREDMRRRVFSFLLHCIPYLIIIILIYIGYITLKSYLDALNSEITSMHDKYNAIATSMQNIVDKISTIPNAIADGLKSIKLF